MKLKNLIILTSITFFLGAGNPDSGKEKVAVVQPVTELMVIA